MAGAGPVGAVAALAAAQRGFEVTVIERNAEVEFDSAPRAATFHPSTLEMLDSLSIMPDFLAVGLVSRFFDYWDRPNRALVARMDHEVLRDDTSFPYVVQTEQHKLVRIVLERLRKLPNVEILLGWQLGSVTQDEHGVTVQAGNGTEERQLPGAWLIGCDGGRSTVRKQLGIEFEGYTWPERFAVFTTRYDFAAAMGCSERSYFADPGQWVNLFKVAGDDLRGRWRVVFAAPADRSDEEVLSDLSAQECLSGLHPGAGLGDLVHRNIYNVHQRVAARFRAGRVFLAGDAAHVNNPIGGLGLNCGIHDAMELVDTLEQVEAGAGAALLDRYERRRRTVNIEFVQQQTVDNKRRLEEKDPAQRRARLDELRAIAGDETRQRAFLRRTSLLDGVARAKAID
ncbi:NAD(P)/FAD-dependent oxidoreductase [Amycolatopsis bartoniae]|uniref:FAD-dependent oxidoreductase n=1 Tax=Amycolatopsis bartoniae TaxID=941986 RepID=UPI0039840FAE